MQGIKCDLLDDTEIVKAAMTPPPTDPEQVMKKLDEIERRRLSWALKPMSSLPPTPSEEDDKLIQFRNNWLSIGQSFGLVASSGVGKSSMVDQMSYHWARGINFLAEPMRPLRIAIIQSEDSLRDIQEQRDGMHWGLKEHEGWTDDEILEAENNIILCDDFLGVVGSDFTKKLALFQLDNRFDMIFINPIQGFFGGDLSQQSDVSEFARVGLDPIMKHPECGCTIGCVMHTAKWKSGDKQNRQSVDDYGEYMMAGSQEWTAWLRACFTFQKIGDEGKYYKFCAAKRGTRLRWKDFDGNYTTKKYFAHSDDGHIYWREVTDASELEIAKSGKAEVITGEQVTSAAYAIAEISKRKHAPFTKSMIVDERKCQDFKEVGSRELRRRAASLIEARPEEFGLHAEKKLCGKSWAVVYGYSKDAKALAEKMGNLEKQKIEVAKAVNGDNDNGNGNGNESTATTRRWWIDNEWNDDDGI